MPVFDRHEPDLRSLIAYMVAAARDKGVTLNQTRLVKLLYLIDVERAAAASPSLTGLRWLFYHYGPYALELPETLEPMEGRELVVGTWQGARMYRAAPGAPDGDDWPSGTRRMVDDVIRRYAALELNELLDHVYFHTAPMRDAVRGQPLDMTQARSNPPLRRQRPLAAPTLPAEAQAQLASWRERRRHSQGPLGRDRGVFLSDPEDERLALEEARGRITVEPDVEP
ncbi:MAG TPA: hypothetical protein VMU32_00720 [Solirubrobacteraceae bacterium]|nr:hypothetical protein [Solirubrobacteraceae bacterium]